MCVCLPVFCLSVVGNTFFWGVVAVLCLAGVMLSFSPTCSLYDEMRDHVYGVCTPRTCRELNFFLYILICSGEESDWMSEWFCYLRLPLWLTLIIAPPISLLCASSEVHPPTMWNAECFWKDTCSDIASLIAFHWLWLVKYWVDQPYEDRVYM